MATIVLIKEAIVSLKDRTGSSVLAINKYIEAEKKVRSVLVSNGAFSVHGVLRANLLLLGHFDTVGAGDHVANLGFQIFLLAKDDFILSSHHKASMSPIIGHGFGQMGSLWLVLFCRSGCTAFQRGFCRRML
jgi:hypothetical protein